MKDYVMFTLSKSPVQNWIDKGHVSRDLITLYLKHFFLIEILNIRTFCASNVNFGAYKVLLKSYIHLINP